MEEQSTVTFKTGQPNFMSILLKLMIFLTLKYLFYTIKTLNSVTFLVQASCNDAVALSELDIKQATKMPAIRGCYTRFSHYRVAPGDRIRRPEQPNWKRG